MVKIPPIKSPTIEAIDRWHEEKAAKKDSGHPYRFIRGSEIGKCERYQWYKFRWVMEPERFEGRMLRLFQTGHREETRMIVDLQNAGVSVRTSDPGVPGQITVWDLDGHFCGHLDGEVEGLPEAPKTTHLLECKTHNLKSFTQLQKYGVEASKPEHVAQMQVYMHKRGLKRGLYMAKCKDNDDLYVERIHYDKARAEALMEKARRIKDNGLPPPRITEDPEAWGCRFCSMKPVCHYGAMPLRNCRTCIHGAPIERSNWFCSLHEMALLADQQWAGCPDQRYKPELIDGEATGVDEAADVRYEMNDGTVWMDRGAEKKAGAMSPGSLDFNKQP